MEPASKWLSPSKEVPFTAFDGVCVCWGGWGGGGKGGRGSVAQEHSRVVGMGQWSTRATISKDVPLELPC